MDEYIGKKYGKLTIIAFDHRRKNRHYFKVKCDCGNEKIAAIEDIRIGDALSCGCLQRELSSKRKKTHGDCKTRLYEIWLGIKKRCLNPNSVRFHCYGGRGISICNEWMDFIPFKKWAIENGYSENLTIDRIDVNGGYCPENCRWAGAFVQANNRRTNHYLEYKGQSKSMMDWCRELGLNYNKIRSRICNYKWDVERAFETK